MEGALVAWLNGFPGVHCASLADLADGDIARTILLHLIPEHAARAYDTLPAGSAPAEYLDAAKRALEAFFEDSVSAPGSRAADVSARLVAAGDGRHAALLASLLVAAAVHSAGAQGEVERILGMPAGDQEMLEAAVQRALDMPAEVPESPLKLAMKSPSGRDTARALAEQVDRDNAAIAAMREAQRKLEDRAAALELELAAERERCQRAVEERQRAQAEQQQYRNGAVTATLAEISREEELEKARRDRLTAVEENSLLKEEIEAKAGALAALRRQMEKTAEECLQLRDRCKELSSRAAEPRDTSALQQRLRDRESDIQGLEQRVLELARAHEAASARVAALEVKERAAERLKEQLERYKAELAQTSLKLVQMEVEVSQHKSESSASAALLADKESMLSVYRKKLAQLEGDLEQATRRQANKSLGGSARRLPTDEPINTNPETTERIARLEAECASLREQLSSSGVEQVEQLKKMLEDERLLNTELRGHILDLTHKTDAEPAQSEPENAELMTSVNEGLKKRIDDLSAQHAETCKELAALKEERAALAQENERLKAQLGEQGPAVDAQASLQTLDTLQELFSRSQRRVRKLSAALERTTLDASLSRPSSARSSAIEEDYAEATAAAVAEETAALKEQLQDLRQQLMTETDARRGLEAVAADLRAQILREDEAHRRENDLMLNAVYALARPAVPVDPCERRGPDGVVEDGVFGNVPQAGDCETGTPPGDVCIDIDKQAGRSCESAFDEYHSIWREACSFHSTTDASTSTKEPRRACGGEGESTMGLVCGCGKEGCTARYPS
eukprot:m51a1_g11861 hypothetical protein (799) ;mRNA; r:511108-513861